MQKSLAILRLEEEEEEEEAEDGGSTDLRLAVVIVEIKAPLSSGFAEWKALHTHKPFMVPGSFGLKGVHPEFLMIEILEITTIDTLLLSRVVVKRIDCYLRHYNIPISMQQRSRLQSVD